MSVTAPPPPRQDELEALIEEARRRARHRRLRNAAMALGLAAIAVGVSAAVVVAGRGSSASGVPDGFQLVHARGPVSHARILWVSSWPMKQRMVDARTGRHR